MTKKIVNTPQILPPNPGIKGGKTMMPENLRFCFPGQERSTLSIRELRELSEKRKLPPVDRTIKPYLVMPKKKNG